MQNKTKRGIIVSIILLIMIVTIYSLLSSCNPKITKVDNRYNDTTVYKTIGSIDTVGQLDFPKTLDIIKRK